MKLEPRDVKPKIDSWRKILDIEPKWTINFQVRKSTLDMSEGNEDALACISVDLRYFSACIEFNSPEIDEAELDAIILHELLHIIIEPISCSSSCGLGEKYEEMASVLCESTIERLMPGYLYLYEKAYGKKLNKGKQSGKKGAPHSVKCRRK